MNADENIQELISLIEKQNAKKILLQLPDGLKQYATRIADHLDAGCIISASPCYGACCIAVDEAMGVGADLIVHVGHSDFGFKDVAKDAKIKVMFYPWKLSIGFATLDAKKINERSLGLVATIQYVDELGKLRDMLKNKHCAVLGQMLGCRVPSVPKGVEAIVYLGSGIFHPSAFRNMPVYTVEPKTGAIVVMDEMSDAKKRVAALAKLEDARSVGILVSSMPGQNRMVDAMKIKQRLEKDKKCYIIYANEISEKTIQTFAIDVFINTACPRIRQDYLGKPVVNYEDL